MMVKRVPNLLCLTLLSCLMLFGCGGDSSFEGQLLPPDKRPEAIDVTFRDLEGKSVSMRQSRGRVVILNFWATWCPSCAEEMPSMNGLYTRFKDSGLIMFAVSIDKDWQRVTDFMKRNRYTLPVYRDPAREAMEVYGVRGIPTTFIIDKKGRVAQKITGPIDWLKPRVTGFVESLLRDNQ
jgi:peroxiredoxin